ncbi:MAG: efflux RND transporter periplasmic adaptor subunit [Calditrichia bacterium]
MRANKLLYIPVIVVLIAVAVILVQAIVPNAEIATGMVEVTELDLSSKIPGRIDSLLVREGDRVHAGQLLAVLESKEIDAKVEQARGVMEAARAKLDMARNGARKEEKIAVERLYRQAQHQFELARKTWERAKSVYADSVISDQEFDQVEFKYKAAKEQLEAAEAKYQMVLNGAREEQIRAAEALFHQAKNAYKEALAYQQETRIVAQADGQVFSCVADAGEIIAAGYPIITLVNPQDAWVVLQLREDQLKGLKVGDELSGDIPALDLSDVNFWVDYIAAMADFATWRATNQKGDFDLRYFEIHLRPVNAVEGLRPGMTARIRLK